MNRPTKYLESARSIVARISTDPPRDYACRVTGHLYALFHDPVKRVSEELAHPNVPIAFARTYIYGRVFRSTTRARRSGANRALQTIADRYGDDIECLIRMWDCRDPDWWDTYAVPVRRDATFILSMVILANIKTGQILGQRYSNPDEHMWLLDAVAVECSQFMSSHHSEGRYGHHWTLSIPIAPILNEADIFSHWTKRVPRDAECAACKGSMGEAPHSLTALLVNRFPEYALCVANGSSAITKRDGSVPGRSSLETNRKLARLFDRVYHVPCLLALMDRGNTQRTYLDPFYHQRVALTRGTPILKTPWSGNHSGGIYDEHFVDFEPSEIRALLIESHTVRRSDRLRARGK